MLDLDKAKRKRSPQPPAFYLQLAIGLALCAFLVFQVVMACTGHSTIVDTFSHMMSNMFTDDGSGDDVIPMTY